jgi:hypothetical protein
MDTYIRSHLDTIDTFICSLDTTYKIQAGLNRQDSALSLVPGVTTLYELPHMSQKLVSFSKETMLG